ncbi:HAD-IB family hydrolase [Streptomyces sp. NPDC050844]|uniref:HAD family hydrolase n=1 Tax=Streptomyces sp. NPDC050844 TaxID=3155790 RepID=UPI0033F0454B
MTTVAERARPALAFFDVDETVIAHKSMVEFWEYWLARNPSRVPEQVGDLRAEAAASRNRAALNRRYYRRYAGVPLADLEAAGRRWYETYRRGDAAFVRAAVDAVAGHRAAGHEVILVSGSMMPLLEPLAQELGAAGVLCTELVVRSDGALTGEVHRPMIGESKAEAAVRTMRERGVDPSDCFAYGDHESDLALLRAVGNPVVVGSSRVLNEEAERSGWMVVPAGRGPLRLESA